MLHAAPCGQKTDRAGQEVLKDPEPQLVVCRAASVPLFAPPSLAAAPDDVVDEIARGFLEEMALKTPEQVERMRGRGRGRGRRKKEEEKAKARLVSAAPLFSFASLFSAGKRKSKKRKKRLPEALPFACAASWFDCGYMLMRQSWWFREFVLVFYGKVGLGS